MEKQIPHCKLTRIKALVEVGNVRTTHSARAGADALGLELADMLAVVMALIGRCDGTYANRFLQEHDYARRPHNLAGCVPTEYASRRRVFEIDGH